MKNFDIGIIGGGILGTTISYWISNLYDSSVCVIDKESDVAKHTSGRNTGVVHTPFYLDPEKKKIFAKSAYLSRNLWKTLAIQTQSPWMEIGTIEVAIDELQHKTLEKYQKWGIENGVNEDSLLILDSNGLKQKEKNLECYSGLLCKDDVSTDYSKLTQEIKNISRQNSTEFIFQKTVKSFQQKNDSVQINFTDNSSIECKYIINCSGGNSLDIAKQFDLFESYSDLHFRGEYWIADSNYADIVKTNIYSVARHPEFPFLDPHWIKRANGTTEIGPNAVPVPTPETYDGFVTDIQTTISKLGDILTGGAKKLFLNPDFLSLITHEFRSSISKDAMVQRVMNFIPSLEPNYFTKKGTAGIRTPVISPEGNFIPDVLEREGQNSFHIVNYNSPGATGAPAYSALVVKKLQDKGFLKNPKSQKNSLWDFNSIIEQI
ncbi:MAG: FAD-dependent oxidoreductase [Candidatus Nitrosopelagicus sp.]|nr:FAD-dependent oxidoreductase [Candidatus Nitrosopelagicus sp.]